MAQKRRSSDSQDSNIWTTVYSDMVTNLMLFFLMLYGLTRMSTDVRADIAKGIEQKFRGKTQVEDRAEKAAKKIVEEDAVEKMAAIVKEDELNKHAKVEVTEKQIRITLDSPVLFDFGSTKLSDYAKKSLSRVAKALKPINNKIVIEGHTDNVPMKSSNYTNWELSVGRAYAVINYFVEYEKIPAERFITAGYGEYRPVASNETEEGRAKNRRIEIVVLR